MTEPDHPPDKPVVANREVSHGGISPLESSFEESKGSDDGSSSRLGASARNSMGSKNSGSFSVPITSLMVDLTAGFSPVSNKNPNIVAADLGDGNGCSLGGSARNDVGSNIPKVVPTLKQVCDDMIEDANYGTPGVRRNVVSSFGTIEGPNVDHSAHVNLGSETPKSISVSTSVNSKQKKKSVHKVTQILKRPDPYHVNVDCNVVKLKDGVPIIEMNQKKQFLDDPELGARFDSVKKGMSTLTALVQDKNCDPEVVKKYKAVNKAIRKKQLAMLKDLGLAGNPVNDDTRNVIPKDPVVTPLQNRVEDLGFVTPLQRFANPESGSSVVSPIQLRKMQNENVLNNNEQADFQDMDINIDKKRKSNCSDGMHIPQSKTIVIEDENSDESEYEDIPMEDDEPML